MFKAKFKRMGHSAILVEDLNKSLTFYRQVLGLKPVWVGDDDWAQLTLGGDDLSLVTKREHVHPPHIGLYVSSLEDLEETHKALQGQLVEVEPISKHRDGTYSFYFKDPDGNLLEALWDPRNLESY